MTPEKIRNKFVILDGNAIIHRAYHALPPLTSKKGQMVNAVYGFGTILIRILKELTPTHVVVTFDLAGPTFRHEKYEDYKATRVKADDELYEQIPLIHELVEAFNIPIVEKKGFEADDCIGTLVKKVERGGKTDVVIVTGDLDTLQLVDDHVTVYTMRKGMSDIVEYDRAEVAKRYDSLTPEQVIDFKALKGDASDNIKGVKGIGEKGAIDLLKNFKSLDGIYKAVDSIDADSGKTGASGKTEKIKPATLKKLIDSRKSAYESQELATIVLDVPISRGLKDFIRKPVNEKALLELLQELEFTSLLSRIPGMKNKIVVAKKKNVKIVELGQGDLSGVFGKIEKEDEVGVVLQTTDEGNFLDKEILGLAIVSARNNWYVSAEVKGWEKLLSAKTRYCVHDSKEFVKVLWENGVVEPKNIFDVMIGSYLLHSESRAHGLDALALKYLGEKIEKSDKQASLFGKPKENVVAEAGAVFGIAKHVDKEMEKVLVWGLYEKIEGPLVEVLARMERHGIAIDSGLLASLAKKVDARLGELEKQIHKHAGKDFNVNSSAQLRDILFEDLGLPTQDIKKGKTGYSTAATELAKLKGFHPIIELIEENRELTKLKTTYIDVLPTLTHEKTKRIHTTFNQTVTATGRLSSSEPNMQNIPTRTEEGRKIRDAFVAGSGCTLVVADYSQVELRIVASLANDAGMIEIFEKGEDIHKSTAAKIQGVALDKVTSDMRRKAKEVNFGVLYGMGSFGLAARTGISRAEAQEFIEKYFNAFKGVKKYIDETMDLAKKKGYVETMFGRRRYIQDIGSSNFQVRAAAERMAINHPVQGTAADLMKLAMIEVDKFIIDEKLEDKVKMLLQVHDELVFEVKDSMAEKIAKQIKEIMESVIKLRVPVETDVGIGKSWGAAK